MKPILIAISVLLASPAFAQSWLLIARPSVELSVSDKFADKQRTVEFVVTVPDGSTKIATATPRSDGLAGTVRYPTDFPNSGTKIGDYTWIAKVAGKEVLSGKFSYRPSNDGQTLFVP